MNIRCVWSLGFAVLFFLSSANAQPLPPRRADPNREFQIEALASAHQFGILGAIAEQFADSPDDALFLEGMLSLLSAEGTANRLHVAPWDLLHRLAQRRWRAPPAEKAGELWSRIQNDIAFLPESRLTVFRETFGQHEKVAKKPAPHDWRVKKEFWQDLFQTLVQSKTDESLTDTWRKKIEADAEHARLYRRAYAAAAIAAKRKLDPELVGPLLEAKEPTARSEIQRVAEVLQILALSACPPDEPWRVELRERLRGMLRADHKSDDLIALARLDAVGGEEQRMLRTTLLRVMQPREFDSYAALAKISPESRRLYYLTKSTQVTCEETPLGVVLRDLQAAVSLSTWIDDEAAAAETPITLKAAGSWLSVLEQVLAHSKYALDMRADEQFWIGPPERKKQARALWNQGLAKAASASAGLSKKLSEPTILEFIRTPLADVVDYLSDLHGVQLILRPAELPVKSVSMRRHGIPFYLALELLATEAKLEWVTKGGLVVLGPPHEIERLERGDLQRLRMSVELASGKGVVGARLRDSTTLEFINTPLSDVCAYLSDLHGLPVAVASGDSALKTSTLMVNDIDLCSALQLLCFDAGLTWSSDGEGVYIGSKAEVERFLKLQGPRELKRVAYPKHVAGKLSKQINICFEDKTLRSAAPVLGDLIGLPVELAAGDDELGKTSIRASLYSTPADVALDLICLEHGLAWDVSESGITIRRAK